MKLVGGVGRGFLGASDGKESMCNAGDPGLISRLGLSPEKGMATHSRFSPGESHGQRNLAGYSQKDHKELNMTEAT